LLVLEGKIAGANFPSQCNVIVGNALMLVLEGKLNFPSRCNVVAGNSLMFMLEGKLWALAFPHDEMLLLAMLLCSC